MFRLSLFILSFILLNAFLVGAVTPLFKGVVTCFDDDDCKYFVNGTCIYPTCMCDGTTLCSEKATGVLTKIGEKCNATRDCNITNSECSNNTCACKNGYVMTKNGRQCLIVAEGLGKSCENSIQCYTKVNHSVCRSQKCVCEGTFEANGTCFKNIELGGACENDLECALNKFSSCKNSTCTCNEGFIGGINNTACFQVSDEINSPCIDELQCTETLGEHSYCFEGLCKCRERYHYKKKINKCVFDRLYGETCSVHSDCHDIYPEKERRLECIYGECRCRYHLRDVNGVCVDKSGVSTIAANFCLLLSVYMLV